MSQDKTAIIQSSQVKAELAGEWKKAVETGGRIVVTTNGIPEYIIYPLRTEVRLIHEDLVARKARDAYYPLIYKKPEDDYGKPLPKVGPDELRKNPGEIKRAMRMLMRPYAYTLYGQTVGLLFPIPYDGEWEFAGALDAVLRPELYESNGKET